MENQSKENNYENPTSQREEAPSDTELKDANKENSPIIDTHNSNKELEINKEKETNIENNEDREEPKDEEIVDNTREAELINKEIQEQKENTQDIKDDKEEEDNRENNEPLEEEEKEEEEEQEQEEQEEREHNEEIEENQEGENNEDYEVDEPQQEYPEDRDHQEYQERQGIHIHRKEEESQEKEVQEENMENRGEIHPMEPVDNSNNQREEENQNEELKQVIEEEENNEQEEEYEEDNENRFAENNANELRDSEIIGNQKVKIIFQNNENYNIDNIKEIPRIMVFKKPRRELKKRIIKQEEEKQEEKIYKLKKYDYKDLVEIPKEKIKIYEKKEIIILKGGIETGEYKFIGGESEVIPQEPAAEIVINKEEILNEINKRSNIQKKLSYKVVDKYYSLTVFEAKDEQTIKALKEKHEKIKAELNIKIPDDNFSKYLLEQINKIRSDPQSFVGVIEDAKDNIKKSRSGKYYYNGNKIKVALKDGESAFNETIEFLKSCQPMEPLEFSKDLIPNPPQNVEEIEDRNYLKKNVELMILNGIKINSYWRDLINDAEISFLLMIVDDNGDKKGMRRNDILNPKMKYIGISSIEINGHFINYFVLSS